jgi:hypothetical protein
MNNEHRILSQLVCGLVASVSFIFCFVSSLFMCGHIEGNCMINDKISIYPHLAIVSTSFCSSLFNVLIIIRLRRDTPLYVPIIVAIYSQLFLSIAFVINWGRDTIVTCTTNIDSYLCVGSVFSILMLVLTTTFLSPTFYLEEFYNNKVVVADRVLIETTKT